MSILLKNSPDANQERIVRDRTVVIDSVALISYLAILALRPSAFSEPDYMFFIKGALHKCKRSTEN